MKALDLEKVGRYEILAKVGEGANGAVFRAQDPTIRRVVALKVIPAEPAEPAAQGPSSADFFDREVQAAGALLHPNIVTLYDAGRDGDWYYLAMEFVEGESFAAEIARQAGVSPTRACEVVAAVADALDFAHERGVIHRDVKPANLMILPDHTAKVADFGIARLASAAQSTMTTGMVLGTPHYMSPEQVTGGTLDGRSDLFSLGVVLYESLTARKPFRGETLAGLLGQIVGIEPPRVDQVRPQVPAELAAIVAKALAKSPADRFARGRELATALRDFAAGRTATAARPSPTADAATMALPAGSVEPLLTPPAKPRSLALPIAAGLAALAVVGGGAWFLVPAAAKPGTTTASNGSATTSAAASGFLEFVSEPAGAEIVVDGQSIGVTPYRKEVPAGKYEIEFRKDGFFPESATVTVSADQRVPVELSLAPKERS